MERVEEQFTDEELTLKGRLAKERFSGNENDMSYWFPKIERVSKIQIPKTLMFQLTDFWYGWVMSDYYTEGRRKDFNDYLISNIKGSFDINNLDVFVKTGVYSDKFYFNNPHVDNPSTIGTSLLNVFYGAMLVGAGTSPTVVVREYIPPKENDGTIYNGMPLRREVRFFVDFDLKRVLGYSDYWHKSEMVQLVKSVAPSINVDEIGTKLLKNVEYLIDNNIVENYQSSKLKDFVTWAKWYLKQGDIQPYVQRIFPEVEELAKSGMLTGKWSIDIMFNSIEEPYLIDMALMQQSALVDVMVRL